MIGFHFVEFKFFTTIGTDTFLPFVGFAFLVGAKSADIEMLFFAC